MICHVCEKSAIGQCKMCNMFYCADHGYVTCQRCAETDEPGAAAAVAGLDDGAAFHADEAEPPSRERRASGRSRCYKCDNTVDRACTSCGRLFCPQHGGVRWAWVETYRSRSGLRHRVVCDECTASQASVILTFVMIIAVLIFFLVVFFNILGSFPRL